MDWEERQTSLENEMMVAKDTIWGLTARIIHLENEVKNLKIVVKYGAKKYTGHVSKAKKPARRSNNVTPTPPTNPKPQPAAIGIKEEVIIPETDSEDEDSNAEMSAVASEDSNNSDDSPCSETSQPMSWKTSSSSKPNMSQTKKVSNGPSGPRVSHPRGLLGVEWGSKGKVPLPTLHRQASVGRKRDPVWKNYTVIENFSESGPKSGRPTAICKKCNRVVSPQPSRLIKHIKNCKGPDDIISLLTPPNLTKSNNIK